MCLSPTAITTDPSRLPENRSTTAPRSYVQRKTSPRNVILSLNAAATHVAGCKCRVTRSTPPTLPRRTSNRFNRSANSTKSSRIKEGEEPTDQWVGEEVDL
ncbi:hypothetical protein L596_025267 [Steinernema carpocapsae]|uniref:Uncharacterized protein n=1 Tax=Steinernema carpocapsae TaxID=34508 RepID=A0A4U5M7B1_STECR|nr:hypothetical protein L596_025267 [Steinernema carpocapsae]